MPGSSLCFWIDVQTDLSVSRFSVLITLDVTHKLVGLTADKKFQLDGAVKLVESQFTKLVIFYLIVIRKYVFHAPREIIHQNEIQLKSKPLAKVGFCLYFLFYLKRKFVYQKYQTLFAAWFLSTNIPRPR